MFDIEYGEGWWVAFGRSRPGCYAAAATLAACREAISAAVADYNNTLRGHVLAACPSDDAVEDVGEAPPALQAAAWYIRPHGQRSSEVATTRQSKVGGL